MRRSRRKTRRIRLPPNCSGVDRELGDFVIVHELLHFSIPNHGKLWKSLMRAHLGDYEGAEERLRRRTEAARR